VGPALEWQAGQATAAPDAAPTTVNVTTSAASLTVGGEFRSELNYNDKGLTKVKGYTPDAASNLKIDTVKLKLAGKLNDSTDFKFRFNLAGPKSSKDVGYTPLDYGYGTHNIGKMFSFAIGKQKVLQGGWDQIDNSFKSHVQGVYADHFAVGKYEPMLTLNLKVAGNVALQVINDVYGAKVDGDKRWNKKQKLTAVLGWVGDLGMVKPLLTIGSYDNQKSRWIDLGVKVSASALTATVDVKLDSIAGKGVDAALKAKELTDTATSITAKAAYDIKNAAAPWIYVSTYDKAQFKDDSLGKKDLKVNDYDAATKTATLSDNALSWGVGADLNGFGKGWFPYLAVVGVSGKFTDASDATKEETRTETQFRIGAFAEI
jgi:hypothetical protein